MRFCWSHEDRIGSMLIPVLIFSMCGCITSAFSLYQYGFFFYSSVSHVLFISFLLFLWFSISFYAFTITSRCYRIDASGITLRYLFLFEQHYCWADVSEVALCKIHYAGSSNKHILAIRCVIGEENRGPKQAIAGKERWSTPEYEMIHFKRIISIFYTPERIAEFHKFCPHSLNDYRHLKDRT